MEIKIKRTTSDMTRTYSQTYSPKVDYLTLNTDMCASEFKEKANEFGLYCNMKKPTFKRYEVKLGDRYYGDVHYDTPRYTYYFKKDDPTEPVDEVTEVLTIKEECKGFWSPECKYRYVEKSLYKREK